MDELEKKLIAEFKKAKICCVHEIGDDDSPCGFTTREAIKIIKKVFKEEKK